MIFLHKSKVDGLKKLDFKSGVHLTQTCTFMWAINVITKIAFFEVQTELNYFKDTLTSYKLRFLCVTLLRVPRDVLATKMSKLVETFWSIHREYPIIDLPTYSKYTC